MAPVPPAAGPDYEKLADLIVAKMAIDPRFKGPKGDDGIDGTNGVGLVGPVGPVGKAAEVDYAKLANDPALLAVLMAKMPAFVIQFTDKSGQVVEELPFQFYSKTNTMTAKFAPLRVETHDLAGKLIDSDKYPYPWGIKLKPIVIPASKGT